MRPDPGDRMDINTNIAEAMKQIGVGLRSSHDTPEALHLIEMTLRSYGSHPVKFDDIAASLRLIRVTSLGKRAPRRVVRCKL